MSVAEENLDWTAVSGIQIGRREHNETTCRHFLPPRDNGGDFCPNPSNDVRSALVDWPVVGGLIGVVGGRACRLSLTGKLEMKI